MWIFIVSWILITVIPPGQWQAHPPDCYGVGGYQTSTSGMHGTDEERTITEHFERAFSSKEEAVRFFKKGKAKENIPAKDSHIKRYELKDFKMRGISLDYPECLSTFWDKPVGKLGKIDTRDFDLYGGAEFDTTMSAD